MIVVTHTRLVRRRRRLALVLRFGGLAVLSIGLFLNRRAPATPSALDLALTVAALITGSVMHWRGILLSDRWVAVPRPEEALAGALRSAGRRYRLYNWVLPADHVLLAPWGLVVLAVFNHDGPVSISGPRWQDARPPLLRVLSFGRRPLRNPQPWLDAEIQALRAAFAKCDDLLALVPIEPLVVFSRPWAVLRLADPSPPALPVAELGEWVRLQSKRYSLSPLVQRRLQKALDELAEARLATGGR